MIATMKRIAWISWLCVIAFGATMLAIRSVQNALGIYQDRNSSALLSPDAIYVAETYFSEQAFDGQTLVTLMRKDGRGARKTVLSYETTEPIKVDLAWSDENTLSIALPCEPPNSISPRFYDDAGKQLRRIIIDAKPRDANCRYKRGTLMAGRDY